MNNLKTFSTKFRNVVYILALGLNAVVAYHAGRVLNQWDYVYFGVAALSAVLALVKIVEIS